MIPPREPGPGGGVLVAPSSAAAHNPPLRLAAILGGKYSYSSPAARRDPPSGASLPHYNI